MAPWRWHRPAPIGHSRRNDPLLLNGSKFEKMAHEKLQSEKYHGVSDPGILELDSFYPNFATFSIFIGGSHLLLLPQRGPDEKKNNHPNMDETEGFHCLGHKNWTICSPLSHFCSEIFPTFSVSYWGAHSYYPRGLIMRKGNSPNSRNG